MRPRGMTLTEVQKGYRDDGDGDDSLSQREQHQEALQLSQERQLLQAAMPQRPESYRALI